jgi:hypothetical protein
MAQCSANLRPFHTFPTALGIVLGLTANASNYLSSILNQQGVYSHPLHLSPQYQIAKLWHAAVDAQKSIKPKFIVVLAFSWSSNK